MSYRIAFHVYPLWALLIFGWHSSHASVRVDFISTNTKEQLGNVHWMVPRNTNTLFTGRQNILEKLNRNLGLQSNSSQTSEQQKRFVIVGDGGIGKSEVCLKFANDYRQQ